MYKFFTKKLKKAKIKRFFKNPLFYFGVFSFILLGVVSFSSNSLAKLDSGNRNTVVFNSFFTGNYQENSDVFFSQNKPLAIETPDLKIEQDSFVYGVSVPHALSSQTLGAIMGGPTVIEERKEVIDYTVQSGDTVQSIADSFGISLNTLLWANDLSKNATLKTGQNLTILPVSGVIHVVKSGDTIGVVAKTYKANVDEVISFNNLTDEGDIYIGDILIIPGGQMPLKTLPSNGQTPLPDSFFIYPIEGQISQGLHYYNAVDIANKCGTSVYASAAGIVQRAIGNGKWNAGMGNYITILHTNGVSTYYGHLMTLFVKPGDVVNVGDRIGLVGKTGQTTGCHVHFQVMGAANPFAKYSVGTVLNYK